jgi:dTMP kinase
VPALESGNIVILDRYFYSTLAYQGARAGTLIGIEGRIRQDVIHPDITFWIDTPPKIAVSRIENRDGAANHFERLDDLIAIDKIFREISVLEKNMICIDGSRPVDDVYESVMQLFIDGPFQRKRCAKSYGCEDHFYCTPRLTNTCEWWQKATKLKNIA